MGQRSHSSLILVLLLLIISTLSSSLHLQHPKQPFLFNTSNPTQSISDPQYKALPILQENSGEYYIEVTWKNASSHNNPMTNESFSLDFTDTPSKNYGKMVLVLYTNLSFVSICTDFLEYDCASLDCQINSLKPIDQSYLLSGTEIQGYSIDVGIVSPAVNMCGYSVVYALYCGEGYPQGISGYLSLGFSLNAFFEVNRNFSIFLSNGVDGLNSTLFVGADDDSDLIDSSTGFQQTWNTDKNWMVTITNITAEVASQPEAYRVGISMANESKALFDINTDAIGMPISLFTNLTSMLGAHGVSCNGSPYQPSCTYDGDVNSLPTFYLNTDGQNQTAIAINSQVYLSKNPGQDTSYTLMFAALASGIPGAIQVSPKYENSIILGRPFLTFYYVHFSVSEDYKQPYVTIYHAQHNSTPPPTSKVKLILIICGSALAVIIVTAIGVYLYLKKRRRNKLRNRVAAEEDRPTMTTSSGNRQEIDRNFDSHIQQPFINPSLDTSQDVHEAKTKKVKDKIWSNENMGYVDPDEINAYTYKKQKYRGLYESDSDSVSLNNDLGTESPP